MPHCILEYSSNIIDQPDYRALLLTIHDTLMQSGQFELADIKSRVIRHEQFLIGDGNPALAFVTCTLQLLAGRSDAVKTALAEALQQRLVAAFPRSLAQLQCSITVQLCDIHRASYQRKVGSTTP
ncbi:5-carboxymethyl-2-hydroxymuconate Delta-isomerase [Chitinilyticum piscinae]|uniref:5-carboxymethyl-2-hydroxymuconate Delta-isomerase n=1 Tax=Chitinilyticum piscinae TaxID=2866724 RepID=A0A8J7G0J5_9NEIS|nr:5-carboxymethyl-2-hydroxymuconate Delta-isomerase [Chitinilyticum piscinae]MBE9609755.1 5-carboxymethyl-2-hydroxymuconate Delta-isomerase [Chitinilyticum piscinae]